MENEKFKLRESLRRRRAGIQTNFDLTNLLESPEFNSAKFVASYRSYGSEPSTLVLNSRILELGKILLLPVLRSDRSLDFRIWNGDESNLMRTGKIEEPTGENYLGPIDLMVIPSLAVSTKGLRLGQGGGSYDRTIASRPSFKITLVFEDEIIESIPVEPHDQKVDAALTPTRLIRF